VLGCFGSGLGLEGEEESFLRSSKAAVCDWVQAGGVLALHGERFVTKLFGWFGLKWCFSGDYYRRVEHKRRSPLEDLPLLYNVKACMVSGTKPEECLYSPVEGAVSISFVPGFGREVDPGLCPLAMAKHGKGRVIFFGDVNWEKPTMDVVMRLLARV
jgi:hypothetical protein